MFYEEIFWKIDRWRDCWVFWFFWRWSNLSHSLLLGSRKEDQEHRNSNNSCRLCNRHLQAQEHGIATSRRMVSNCFLSILHLVPSKRLPLSTQLGVRLHSGSVECRKSGQWKVRRYSKFQRIQKPNTRKGRIFIQAWLKFRQRHELFFIYLLILKT